MAPSTTRMVVFDDPEFAPSQRMLTMVRDLAAERGDIEVEHVDVWRDPGQGLAHRVMTVPTTIIFVGGEEQERLCGLRSTRCLTRTIDRIMHKQLSEQPIRVPDRPEIGTASVA